MKRHQGSGQLWEIWTSIYRLCYNTNILETLKLMKQIVEESDKIYDF
jgi:hypothetical protein